MPVPDFDVYEVSDAGRVRSIDRMVNRPADSRRGGFTSFLRGKVLTPAANPAGYLHVNLYRDGRAHSRDVHTLVLRAFVGPPPDGMEGCHKDGDPSHNCVINLRWDTSSANQLDVTAHGRNVLRNRSTDPRGHALTVPNLVPSALRTGNRTCLACNRARARIRNGRLRGQPVLEKLGPLADQFYATIMRQEGGPTG